MKTEQRKWTSAGGWKQLSDNNLKDAAQLVLVFGGTSLVKDAGRVDEIRSWYPNARAVVCSTAGEIIGTEVLDDSLCVTAVAFSSTQLQFAEAKAHDASESRRIGEELGKGIPHEGLVHVMVFAEGLNINGTQLVLGLRQVLPQSVSVTGGLVGDGANFKETVVGLDGPGESGRTVIFGLYGTSLHVGYGSLGGWDSFGPERTITKSDGHILYELDGRNALALYKEYLGEQAKGLPGSGLLFPLSLRLKTETGEANVVRTILAVDEEKGSMTFAGDMPEGSPAQLMKANFDRLIDGAEKAASMSIESIGGGNAELAILISCIGRKLVLKERVEEEIEAVQKAVGSQAAITGFYSYGELCPTAATEKQCQLHNQTMTITTLREV